MYIKYEFMNLYLWVYQWVYYNICVIYMYEWLNQYVLLILFLILYKMSTSNIPVTIFSTKFLWMVQ